MFRKFYFIPNCPYCGSERTGSILYLGLGATEEELYRMGHKRNELVRVKTERGRVTCYCEDCDGEWYAKITSAWLRGKDYEKALELKGLSKKDFYIMLQEKEKSKQELQKKKKEEKKKPIKNLLHQLFKK